MHHGSKLFPPTAPSAASGVGAAPQDVPAATTGADCHNLLWTAEDGDRLILLAQECVHSSASWGQQEWASWAARTKSLSAAARAAAPAHKEWAAPCPSTSPGDGGTDAPRLQALSPTAPSPASGVGAASQDAPHMTGPSTRGPGPTTTAAVDSEAALLSIAWAHFLKHRCPP